MAEAVAGGRGGAVIAQLRAALEEERRALLVQAEHLRLSLDDECDYRAESAVPAPSVPEMTQLKLALQESLARAEHEASAPALRASLGSRDPRPPRAQPPQAAAAQRAEAGARRARGTGCAAWWMRRASPAGDSPTPARARASTQNTI